MRYVPQPDISPVSSPPRFGVAVPAKDPGPLFPSHLDALSKLSCPGVGPIELVVVDDGSSTTTVRDVCNELNIPYVQHSANRGKGAALRTGFSELFASGFAATDLIGFIDGDGDISADHLSTYATALHVAPLDVVAVIASKTSQGSRASVPLWRRWGSKAFSKYTSVVMPTGIRDTQAGAKMFRAEFLSTALPLTTNDRFLLDVELLAIAHHWGCVVHTAPVRLSIDSTSTIDPSTAWQMACELTTLSYRTRRGQRYKLASPTPVAASTAPFLSIPSS